MPCTNKLIHNIKGTAQRYDAPVVFSAPNKLRNFCPGINTREWSQRSEYMMWHHKYVLCKKRLVYAIPQSCRPMHMCQMERCVNDSLHEHNVSLKCTPSGHLVVHMHNCCCAPVLEKSLKQIWWLSRWLRGASWGTLMSTPLEAHILFYTWMLKPKLLLGFCKLTHRTDGSKLTRVQCMCYFSLVSFLWGGRFLKMVHKLAQMLTLIKSAMEDRKTCHINPLLGDTMDFFSCIWSGVLLQCLFCVENSIGCSCQIKHEASLWEKHCLTYFKSIWLD